MILVYFHFLVGLMKIRKNIRPPQMLDYPMGWEGKLLRERGKTYCWIFWGEFLWPGAIFFSRNLQFYFLAFKQRKHLNHVTFHIISILWEVDQECNNIIHICKALSISSPGFPSFFVLFTSSVSLCVTCQHLMHNLRFFLV